MKRILLILFVLLAFSSALFAKIISTIGICRQHGIATKLRCSHLGLV